MVNLPSQRTRRLLIGLFVIAAAACSRRQAEAKPPAKSAAPAAGGESALPDQIGPAELKQLLAKHKGKPVLINVFASWCKPCRVELPDLAKLKKDHPKLVLIGIDVDDA